MAVYGIHHVSMKCGSPENLPAVKAQRVEDLLSGEAAKKQKAAKKAWREQMKKVK